MKDPSNWVVSISIVVIGWVVLSFVAHGILGYWFWRHLDFLFYVWFLLPFAAYKLKLKSVRSRFSIPTLVAIRNGMLAIAIAISLGFFFHYGNMRDSVGRQYVEGYYTTTSPDVTDSGQQTTSTDAHTAHWYSALGLWAGGWVLIIMCFAIPVLTWRGANEAIREATVERDEHVA